jgi:uncharacterized protein YndB with AHSA1/START domain
MRAISATIDVAATPQQVWGVLADLDAYPQWNPVHPLGLRAASREGDPDPAAGPAQGRR